MLLVDIPTIPYTDPHSTIKRTNAFGENGGLHVASLKTNDSLNILKRRILQTVLPPVAFDRLRPDCALICEAYLDRDHDFQILLQQLFLPFLFHYSDCKQM